VPIYSADNLFNYVFMCGQVNVFIIIINYISYQ
jgi:hypothetical protein